MKYIVIMPAAVHSLKNLGQGGFVKKGQKRSDIIYGFPLYKDLG